MPATIDDKLFPVFEEIVWNSLYDTRFTKVGKILKRLSSPLPGWEDALPDILQFMVEKGALVNLTGLRGGSSENQDQPDLTFTTRSGQFYGLTPVFRQTVQTILPYLEFNQNGRIVSVNRKFLYHGTSTGRISSIVMSGLEPKPMEDVKGSIPTVYMGTNTRFPWSAAFAKSGYGKTGGSVLLVLDRNKMKEAGLRTGYVSNIGERMRRAEWDSEQPPTIGCFGTIPVSAISQAWINRSFVLDGNGKLSEKAKPLVDAVRGTGIPILLVPEPKYDSVNIDMLIARFNARMVTSPDVAYLVSAKGS